MSHLVYFNNTINYIEQLTQGGEKGDLKKYINSLRSSYTNEAIMILVPFALLLSCVLLVYSHFILLILFLCFIMSYIYICNTVITLLERSQAEFLELCKSIIEFEAKAKNGIQIGKYDSQYKITQDIILKQFNELLLLILSKHNTILNQNSKVEDNHWDNYLRLKPSLFKLLFNDFNDSYCQSKPYVKLYFVNNYDKVKTIISSELNKAIRSIEVNHNHSDDDKAMKEFLSKIENSDATLNLSKRVSDLLQRHLSHINKYTQLIQSIRDNNQEDIKECLTRLITHKETSLTSLNAIYKELFTSIEPLISTKEKTEGIDTEMKIESKGKPYSLFDLFLSQRINKDENNKEENKETINKEQPEKINLFELLKGEREVRGLKTSLIDELADYHKKNKGNEEVLNDSIQQ